MMTSDARLLVGFVVRHTVFGFGLSAVFVSALVWADVGQLRALFSTSPVGWLGAFLLFFFTGLTFASVQLGIAVMQIGSNDDG